jgi:hypothetical protein
MGDEVLCIGLLGTFSVTLNGDAVPDDAWRLRKAKTLIKLLALAPEQRLHADQAADQLRLDLGRARDRLPVAPARGHGAEGETLAVASALLVEPRAG